MRAARLLSVCVVFLFFQNKNYAQLNYEIGAEISAASFSTFGGTAGGGLRLSIVDQGGLAFGPSFRCQYFWSKNNYTGAGGNGVIYGGGAFLHYRFMDWFFVGAEVEMLKNPYNFMKPENRWALTSFVGLGMSREFLLKDYPVRLNFGIFYDVADGIRDPLKNNPSPLRNSYFIRLSDPTDPTNQGRYLPIIYRITLFFPLTRKSKKEDEELDF